MVLELRFARQIRVNGENGETVGKDISYHEKSKCKGPVSGRNEVSQEAGMEGGCA